MFDIGWSEILVIALVSLIVIGPKELPEMLRSCGRMMRKAQLMMAHFRSQVDSMIQESEYEKMRQQIMALDDPLKDKPPETSASETSSPLKEKDPQ